jgi:glycosyltransferase involved in cell wall biosynthesis
MSNKVLLIAGAFAGGIGKHVLDVIVGLHQSFGLSLAYSTLDTDNDFVNRIAAVRKMIGSDRLLPLKIRKGPSLTDPLNVIALIRFIKSNGISVVHGHGAKGGAYARIVTLFCPEVRAIYTPHGGAVHSMHGVFGNRIYGIVENVLLSRTECCLFESEYTQRAFFERVGSSCVKSFLINYNGINPISVSDKSEAEKVLIKGGWPSNWISRRNSKEIHCCCIGLVRPVKGQWVLLNAWRGVLEQHPGAFLHLLGAVNNQAVLAEELKNLGIDHRVLIYGDVPSARQLLKLYDFCLIPSIFESFGYVAIEAMAEGIPVVASRTGGLIEVVDDGCTGMLVHPGDPVAWESSLRRLFSDTRVSLPWIQNARDKVRAKFSLDRMLRTIAEVYGTMETGS